MDNSSFASLLAEKHAEQATTAGYIPTCGHRDVDYLGGNVMLAMLTESCK